MLPGVLIFFLLCGFAVTVYGLVKQLPVAIGLGLATLYVITLIEHWPE